jgi:serine/threonine protein kinase
MAEFPTYYHPGSILILQLATGIESVTVIHASTPFTSTQVLLIHLHNRPAVVKVYDPRFIDYRQASKPARPWSYELEEKAIHQTTPDPNFDFSIFPGADDRVGWEIWYYQHMECGFRGEVEFYKHLHSLQGLEIPRCYGSGTLILANRAFHPRILLLEYIPDAVNLKEIVVKPNQSVIVSLINTVYVFHTLGVTHNDLNSTNILFCPHSAPTRAVIIDFGEAYFREDGDSDQEWNEIVKGSGDAGAIKRVLTWKGWESTVSRIMYRFVNNNYLGVSASRRKTKIDNRASKCQRTSSHRTPNMIFCLCYSTRRQSSKVSEIAWAEVYMSSPSRRAAPRVCRSPGGAFLRGSDGLDSWKVG